MNYYCKICGILTKLRNTFHTNNVGMKFPEKHYIDKNLCHGFFEETVTKPISGE